MKRCNTTNDLMYKHCRKYRRSGQETKFKDYTGLTNVIKSLVDKLNIEGMKDEA